MILALNASRFSSLFMPPPFPPMFGNQAGLIPTTRTTSNGPVSVVGTEGGGSGAEVAAAAVAAAAAATLGTEWWLGALIPPSSEMQQQPPQDLVLNQTTAAVTSAGAAAASWPVPASLVDTQGATGLDIDEFFSRTLPGGSDSVSLMNGGGAPTMTAAAADGIPLNLSFANMMNPSATTSQDALLSENLIERLAAALAISSDPSTPFEIRNDSTTPPPPSLPPLPPTMATPMIKSECSTATPSRLLTPSISSTSLWSSTNSISTTMRESAAASAASPQHPRGPRSSSTGETPPPLTASNSLTSVWSVESGHSSSSSSHTTLRIQPPHPRADLLAPEMDEFGLPIPLPLDCNGIALNDASVGHVPHNGDLWNTTSLPVMALDEDADSAIAAILNGCAGTVTEDGRKGNKTKRKRQPAQGQSDGKRKRSNVPKANSKLITPTGATTTITTNNTLMCEKKNIAHISTAIPVVTTSSGETEPEEEPHRIWYCTFGNCDKTFKSGAGLRYHLDRTHDAITARAASIKSRPRPYICVKCGKDFSTTAGLRYHNRTTTQH
ncbi:hypothetical protein HK102_005597 [Quaeritorhiza haematococci]|nr:hypothetical protein HK102_005597 [Quaeritorhiza haematococci]